MKLKAMSGMMLTLLMASIVMANIATVLASPLEGDIEPSGGDGDVDINDLRTCAAAFGSMGVDDPETSWDETTNWNPIADVNGDGLIDIFDLRIIARHYGETE